MTFKAYIRGSDSYLMGAKIFEVLCDKLQLRIHIEFLKSYSQKCKHVNNRNLVKEKTV